MSGRRRKPLWSHGWVAVHPEAARALRSSYAAAAVEVVYQYVGHDGWAVLSNDRLAAEIGCSRGQAPKILEKLVDCGLLETGGRDRHGRGRYRPVLDEAEPLVSSSELSDDAQQVRAGIAAKGGDDCRKTAAKAPQNAAPDLPQNAAPNPHQEPDRGSENGRSAAGTDLDLDVDLEGEQDKLAPETSTRDVGNGQGGISWQIPPEGKRAPKDSVEEALRKLAHCHPHDPQLVANLAHNFEREFGDPWDWKGWQRDWAPDFPTPLVIRVLRFVRRATPDDRERLRVHLIVLGQQAALRREQRASGAPA